MLSWHLRKAKSLSGRSWGLVAPILVDCVSDTERLDAAKTVEAFCTHNFIHLVAVILLPSAKCSNGEHPRGNTSNELSLSSRRTWSFAKQGFETYLGASSPDSTAGSQTHFNMVLEYVEMIRASRGKVITIANSKML
jgi:hypothetical protein